MQELGKQNPDLLTLINQHQQEFLRIINEPVPPEQAEQVSQQIAQFQAAGMGGAGGGEQGGPFRTQPQLDCLQSEQLHPESAGVAE